MQLGIVVVNPDWTDFVLTPAHLDMSENDFKAIVKAHPPEILILPCEAWRIISFDELKLKLGTHDNDGGTSRNTERSLKFGPQDVGESISAQSSYSMSGLAGSHGDGTPIPAAFCFAACSLDPGWTVGAPVFTTFGGMKIEPSYFANPKGSFVPEMLMKHLKF